MWQVNPIICAKVKEFSGRIYKAKDFLEIVHLVDLDGAFIDDEQVQIKTGKEKADPKNSSKPYYAKEYIYCNSPENIKKRNKRKRRILDKMILLSKIWRSIPYSTYYFSCNLDHVIHNNANMFDCDKYAYANKFEDKFANNPHGVIEFLQNEEIAIAMDYSESWNFVKTGTNSLKRSTNFHLFFTKPKNPR